MSTSPVIINYASGPSAIKTIVVMHTSSIVGPGTPKMVVQSGNLSVGGSISGTANIESAPNQDSWSIMLVFASDPSTTFLVCDVNGDMPQVNAPTNGSPVTITLQAATPKFGAVGTTAGNATIQTGDTNKPEPFFIMSQTAEKMNGLFNAIPELVHYLPEALT